MAGGLTQWWPAWTRSTSSAKLLFICLLVQPRKELSHWQRPREISYWLWCMGFGRTLCAVRLLNQLAEADVGFVSSCQAKWGLGYISKQDYQWWNRSRSGCPMQDNWIIKTQSPLNCRVSGTKELTFMVLQQVSSLSGASPLLKGRICSKRLAEGFPLIMDSVTGVHMLCTTCDVTSEEPWSSMMARCSAGDSAEGLLSHIFILSALLTHVMSVFLFGNYLYSRSLVLVWVNGKDV